MFWFTRRLPVWWRGQSRRQKLVSIASVLVLTIVALAVWLGPLPALADNAGNIPSGGTSFFSWEFWARIFAWLLLAIASLFIRVTLFFLSFILEISAYNGYLDATAVNVGWVMVRDIGNMFFVVILLIMAFGTILGIEQYEWKKLLVKFVMAAIFVNFSRIICGVFIDISQLIMTTFVNGIAATAGGNVINMFNLQKILQLSRSESPESLTAPGVFTASVAAVTFAGMAMMTLGMFVFLLLARLIKLWVLIVLSPLAFVLSVLPNTQGQASTWWKEFGGEMVTGPALLFFIWLAFVTAGTGQVNNEIAGNVPESLRIKDGAQDNVGGQSIGIGDAMSWNNMAGFAIAIGMLWAGAKVAGSLGGIGGDWAGRAVDFGKKVATIASGYAAGRWFYEGAVKPAAKGVGKGVGFLAANAPIFGGLGSASDIKTKVGNYAKAQYNAYKNKRLEAAQPGIKKEKRLAVRQGGVGNLEWVTEDELNKRNAEIEAKRARGEENVGPLWERSKNERGETVRYEPLLKKRQVAVTADQAKNDKGEALYSKEELEKMKNVNKEELRDNQGNFVDWDGNVVATEKRVDAQGRAVYFDAEGKEIDASKVAIPEYKQHRVLEEREVTDAQGRKTKVFDEKLAFRQEEGGLEMETPEELRERAGWFWGSAGRRQAALKSSGKKLKKTEDHLKQLEDRLSAQTGGVPASFIFGSSTWTDGEDRMVQGMNKAEKARSAAKTEEFQALGEGATLGSARFKDGKLQTERGLLADQIAGHKARADATAAAIKELTAAAKTRYAGDKKGKQALEAKVFAELKTKTQDALYKKSEGEALSKLATKMPEGLSEIVKTIEAEKAAHLEKEKLETKQKEKERAFYESEKGKEELAESALLKTKKEAAEGRIKALEGQYKRFVLGAEEGKEEFDKNLQQLLRAEGEKALAEKVKWEQRQKRGEPMMKAREEAERAEFVKEGVGAEWLRDQKEAEVKTMLSTARVKAEEQKRQADYVSNEGKAIAQALADAEVGGKIGDEFLTKIKNEHLTVEYKKARQDIADKLSIEDKDERDNQLKQLAADNPYVRALQASQSSAWEGTLAKVYQQEAESAAKGAFVEMEAAGFVAPSTALENLGDAVGKPLDRLDEPGRGALAAKTIANAAYKIKQLLAGGKSVNDLDDSTKIYMYGVLKNLVAQGNLDDAGGAGIASDLDRLAKARKGEIRMGAEERARIEAMEELFGTGGQFDVGIKQAADGTHHYEGNKATAGILQNWMISGGNAEQLQTHLDIEKFQDHLTTTTGKEVSYEDATKQYFANQAAAIQAINGNAAHRRVDSLEAYKDNFKSISTQLLDGAEGFKKDGLNANHSENIGHQTSDNDFGAVRFATRKEAAATVRANIRKIQGKGPSTNVHSLGTWDYNTNDLKETDVIEMATHLGSSKRYQDVGRVLDRTLDGVLGYVASKDKVMEDGSGFLGGEMDVKKLEERFGRGTQGGGGAVGFIARKVIPAIVGGMEAMNNLMMRKFGNVTWQESEAGFHHARIAGEAGKEIESDHMADMIKQIMDKYSGNLQEFVDVLKAQGSSIDTVDKLRAVMAERQGAAEQLRREYDGDDGGGGGGGGGASSGGPTPGGSGGGGGGGAGGSTSGGGSAASGAPAAAPAAGGGPIPGTPVPGPAPAPAPQIIPPQVVAQTMNQAIAQAVNSIVQGTKIQSQFIDKAVSQASANFARTINDNLGKSATELSASLNDSIRKLLQDIVPQGLERQGVNIEGEVKKIADSLANAAQASAAAASPAPKPKGGKKPRGKRSDKIDDNEDGT